LSGKRFGPRREKGKHGKSLAANESTKTPSRMGLVKGLATRERDLRGPTKKNTIAELALKKNWGGVRKRMKS